MYLRTTLGLGLAVVTAATILITAAGAGTGHVAIAKIDLATNAGVAKYLRSIHINPKHVVIQRGTRNYAGPSCPGAGWTCTSTARPVVQIAAAGGKNTFLCTTARCAVVQAATSAAAVPNTAKCIRTTGISQSCSINQTNTTANNTAIVYENASKSSGLTQNASATAQIKQTGTSGANTACVNQKVDITGSTVAKKGSPVTVTLDAHQSISITQDSASGGNTVQNASPTDCLSGDLMQSQKLTSNATGSMVITQKQNAAAGGPNMLIDIEQNQSPDFLGSATGENHSSFSQESTLSAAARTALTGSVSQTQGTSGGGLQATVNQFSHGLSTSSAIQSENQCEHAQLATDTQTLECNISTHNPSLPGYTLEQTQFGPVRCCSNQADFAGNTFTVSQTSVQSNDSGNNQTNDVRADCSTSGNCTANQTTTVNGETTLNSDSGQEAHAQTTCTGSDCTTQTTNPDLIPHTDVAKFGYGGMRGDGTGTITVSGVTGTVSKALLFWNGPTNSNDASANADVKFADNDVTGTNIGFASDNCWSFSNSQSYRADVTSFVTGNGTYSLSDFRKPAVEGPPIADINGVSLIVFYDDGNTSNDRNVVMFNGNDSNVSSTFDAVGWDETLTGVPYPGSGDATLDLVVSDGQTFADDALVLNDTELAPAGPIFQGDSTPAGPFDAGGDASGSLWDIKSFDITNRLSSGLNDLHLTTGLGNDCLSLVVAMANVPVSSGPVITSTAGPQQLSAAVQAGSTPVPSLRSTRVLPSAPGSGGPLRTATSPLRGVRSGGVLVQR